MWQSCALSVQKHGFRRTCDSSAVCSPDRCAVFGVCPTDIGLRGAGHGVRVSASGAAGNRSSPETNIDLGIGLEASVRKDRRSTSVIELLDGGNSVRLKLRHGATQASYRSELACTDAVLAADQLKSKLILGASLFRVSCRTFAKQCTSTTVPKLFH
jgi:hypothetical protein